MTCHSGVVGWVLLLEAKMQDGGRGSSELVEVAEIVAITLFHLADYPQETGYSLIMVDGASDLCLSKNTKL